MDNKPFEISKENNNFYDDVETYHLQPGEIMIGGEVHNPGLAKSEGLPLRSVIVKEALLDGDGNTFVGAYRYDGFSLFDLLNDRVIRKDNAEEFEPIIDLYVEISNDEGDKVIISWGEIYYPIHLHEIIVATSVARIVPSKTQELWPLPGDYKLVVAGDLLTERNIKRPSLITVKSYSGSYETVKGLTPLYSPDISIYSGVEILGTIDQLPDELPRLDYESVFYGRGRGIHSTTPFHGVALERLLRGNFKMTKSNLMHGFFVVAAQDGYRTVFTFSEVLNRNDQSEVLLVDHGKGEEGGRFRLYPSGDFFSDRAVKAINEIRFMNGE